MWNRYVVAPFRWLRNLIARLAGYILIAAVLVILGAAFVFKSDFLANPTAGQALAFLTVLLALMRLDVAVANESLRTDIAAETKQVTRVAERVETTQREVQGDVRQQAKTVEAMRQTLYMSGQLCSLETAMVDLDPRLERVGKGEEVKIDQLGLNMSQAWERLGKVIRHLVVAKRARVHFRLLILGRKAASGISPDETVQVPLPQAVEEWLESADAKRRAIEADLRHLANASEGRLTYDVRSYRDLPIVHGTCIGSPVDASYVAVCRWDASRQKSEEFWWAGDEYHRVLGPASAQQDDMVRILRGYFDRWWAMNEPRGPAPAAT